MHYSSVNWVSQLYSSRSVSALKFKSHYFLVFVQKKGRNEALLIPNINLKYEFATQPVSNENTNSENTGK